MIFSAGIGFFRRGCILIFAEEFLNKKNAAI